MVINKGQFVNSHVRLQPELICMIALINEINAHDPFKWGGVGELGQYEYIGNIADCFIFSQK